MKVVFAASALAFALTLAPALALEGQPAAPSGAPEAAAKSGSSEAGNAGAVNENKSNVERKKSQDEMGNPHKN